MTSAVTTIKTAYEVEGMTPEQIAEDQNWDITVVKAALMNASSKYRKACGAEDEDEDRLNFGKSEQQIAKQIILEAAQCAETFDGRPDYKTRAQNAQYIRDDSKGRKDVVRQIAGSTQFNVFAFNETIQQAKALANKAKQRHLIEV